MLAAVRFLWRATQGHRLRPWRSPLLRWRIETFSGIPAEEIGFVRFTGFCWRRRRELRHFLVWCGQMSRYRRASGHAEQSANAGPGENG